MMYMTSSASEEYGLSVASDNRRDYSSENTNETSLIAKSMSWNYSEEVDDTRPDGKDSAWKRDDGGIVDLGERNDAENIAENKGSAERKDSVSAIGSEVITEREEDEGTTDAKDSETIADNTNNTRLPEETDDARQRTEDHVTGSATETGHVTSVRGENSTHGHPQSSSEGRRHRRHPTVKAKDDQNLRRTVELAAAQSSKPRSGLIPHQSEKPHDVGKATVTRCILATSRFIWLPICQPKRGCRHSEVMDEALVAAAECVRWHLRRNALCDHMLMPMPQETRERIEKDVADRKTSVTRKVSQYLKAAFNTSNYDVDLI